MLSSRSARVAGIMACLIAVAAPSAAAARSGPFRFFAPTSFLNRPLSGAEPLDPNSRGLVAELVRSATTTGRSIATTTYSTPIYTVGPDQPTVRVALTLSNSPALQQALDEVPLPDDARPAAGTDGNLTVWQPSTDTLWEFWRLRRDGDGWRAGGGGRMHNASTSPGYYRALRGPGDQILEQPFWGAPASKISLAGGVMTLEELRAGHIDHALTFAIPYPRAGVWSFPAQATDGDVDSPKAIPEGARFRLDPSVDIDSLHLPPLTRMMAVAAQKYGMIVNNHSRGIVFRAEDPTPTGTNPFVGPDGRPKGPGDLFTDWPSVLVAKFPWTHLQLLKMDLRTTAGPF